MAKRRQQPNPPTPAAVKVAADRAVLTAAAQGGRAGVQDGQRELALAALRKGRSISGAARAAGVGRSTLYRWMSDDPEFNKAVEDAYEEGTDALEDVLLDMASGDPEIGRAPQFLPIISTLKARRGHKWRENVKIETETTHKVDGAAFQSMFGAFADKLRETVGKQLEARKSALIEQGLMIDGEALDVTKLLPPGAGAPK